MSVDTPPGPLMLDLDGTSLAPEERELLQRECVGAVILFERNYRSPAQLEDLTAALRDCRSQLLIAVDQEGGRVQRFRDGFTRLPSLARFGELYGQDPAAGLAAAEQGGWLMAAELIARGVDFSFAPVLDLWSPRSRVIGRRAFSASPAAVSHLGRAFVSGMHRAGMAATGKHFPGHGSVAGDSHTELPVDDRNLQELQSQDLVPFRECAALLDAVMPAHVIYPAVDSRCAGFSSRWLQDILREELGFGGIIFSDDLSMQAAHSAGAVEQRTEAALQAGCDMILVCNNRLMARTVADWLEGYAADGRNLLPRMRRRREHDPDVLRASAEWQAAAKVLAELVQGDHF